MAIQSATAEQWRNVENIVAETFEEQTAQPTDDEIRSAVRSVYRRSGVDPEAILIADSPVSGAMTFKVLQSTQLDSQFHDRLQTQLRGHLIGHCHRQLKTQLKEQLGSRLEQQLDDELRYKLGVPLNSRLESPLEGQLYRYLRGELEETVSEQLRDHLEKPFRVQLHEQLNRQVTDYLGSALFFQVEGNLKVQLHRQMDEQLGFQMRRSTSFSLLWRFWRAYYRCGAEFGVQFDNHLYTDFCNWCRCVPQLYATGLPIVSRNPVEVHWDDGREVLHCDDGPAVRFRDGWSLWMIRGVRVNEQIVMRPHEQTVEEIRNETNAEVKRIRIERFGWNRYLK